MTNKTTVIATIAALTFGAALSAQGQGFNDRTEIRFDRPSQAPQVAVEARVQAFNDRTGVSFDATPSDARADLGSRMVDAELKGFNDKSDV